MVFKKDLEQERTWVKLLGQLKKIFEKRPDGLKGVLFLIGVQELGQGPRNYSKEEKEDLIHIAICKVLSLSGYYQLRGTDKDGWPHWELTQKLPSFDLMEQEQLLKMHVIEYFNKEVGIEL